MATTLKSPPKLAASSSGGLSRIIRPLIWLLILLIVAALCITGTWFYLHWQSSRELNPVQLAVGQSSAPANVQYTKPAPVQIPAPIFTKLDPFTVMLESKDSERMLFLGITLRLGDQQSSDRIEKYMPEVRSRILMILSSLTPQDVQTAEGKAKMVQEITAAVSKPFAPIPDGQNVSGVLFTDFVVQ
jgi:flagellar FliL protein